MKKLQYNRGFSLIEMLVSLAIFAIVITMSVSALLVLIDLNAKSQNVHIAVDNLSFVLDSLTRKIRTGDDIYCGTSITDAEVGFTDVRGNDCSGNGVAVVFTDGRTGDRIGYALSGTSIVRSINGASWVQVTGDDIEISLLRITVSDATGSNFEPPSVTLYIQGTVADVNSVGTNFNLQTTVVQRNLEL